MYRGARGMRCKGCNVPLLSGSSRNKHTGEIDDLCPVCRDPHWDNGIIYQSDDNKGYSTTPIKFLNEADFEKDYVVGGWTSMREQAHVIKSILVNGYITMEEI